MILFSPSLSGHLGGMYGFAFFSSFSFLSSCFRLLYVCCILGYFLSWELGSYFSVGVVLFFASLEQSSYFSVGVPLFFALLEQGSYFTFVLSFLLLLEESKKQERKNERKIRTLFSPLFRVSFVLFISCSFFLFLSLLFPPFSLHRQLPLIVLWNSWVTRFEIMPAWTGSRHQSS